MVVLQEHKFSTTDHMLGVNNCMGLRAVVHAVKSFEGMDCHVVNRFSPYTAPVQLVHNLYTVQPESL